MTNGRFSDAILGTQNERLVLFEVAPLRRRSRKLKEPEGTPPAGPAQAA